MPLEIRNQDPPSTLQIGVDGPNLGVFRVFREERWRVEEGRGLDEAEEFIGKR